MCVETEKLLLAQSAVGVALRGSAMSLKVLAANSGLHPNSVAGYFPPDPAQKPTQLSGGSLLAVLKHLPSDLADLLLPDGYKLVEVPDSIDVHEIGRIVAELHALKTAAHHPDSPAGVEISECETRAIATKAAELKAVS
ncbi:MAG: hypothetical protein HRT64_00685 [Erythrobacter sp.]|nr:hypothetical protein [Erythrobacter sp.]